MCHLSTKDQYVCQSHHRIAEAVTGVLGRAQFPSGPFYHPRSSRGHFGHPREAAVRAGNFPDSNGISDDFKRQNRSHETEPVPVIARGTFHSTGISRFIARPGPVPLQRPHVHPSCDVAAAYSGRLGPRESLHARDVPLPLFGSMLSETPGARQPLSISVD